MATRIVTLILRLCLTGVFGIAGFLKLNDPENTLQAIYQFRLLPWDASALLATHLPWIELVAAVGLWIPRLRQGAATLCAALSLTFLAALISALARNLDIACGCFGASDTATQLVPRILMDFLLLGASLWLGRSPRARPREQLPIAPHSAN